MATSGSTADANSYATASITPGSNRLILAWVTNTKATTPDTPTLSGNGLTWVQVNTVTWGTIATPTARTTLFRAMGSAPSSGAVTISFGGVTQTGAAWTIIEFDSVDPSGANGANAVVQSVTGRTDNATAAAGLSITLAALQNAANATAGGFSNFVNNASSISAGSGYTAFAGATYNTPSTSLRAEWRAAGSTTVNVTQSAVSHIGGIAVEVRHRCPGGVVTTTTDSGAGSLRECINHANANPGTTISFSIPNTDPNYTNGGSGTDYWWRIAPASALPTITANGTIIDGTTQTTNRGNTNTAGPEVELKNTGLDADGFTITSGSNVIRGLVVNGFNIGTRAGILLSGGSATGNTIAGNYIGTNSIGSAASPNVNGVRLVTGATGNTVGGGAAADRNIISGNGNGIINLSSNGNIIKGNYIGTNLDGTGSIANSSGIYVSSSTSVTIGGSTSNDKNVISGNTGNGIYVGTASNSIVIQGNYIGTNAAGTAAIPITNQNYGINIQNSTSLTIGGAAAGERNIVSGNTITGISLATSSSAVVKGNYIGTDAAGSSAIPNGKGIEIYSATTGSTIGGATAGERNIISGNAGVGFVISGAGTSNNVVKGNYIGVQVNGTDARANGSHGVLITSDASSNTIGGVALGEGNTIANNTGDGIYLAGANSDNNRISGNSIFSNTDLGIDLDPNGVGTGGGTNNDKARPTITGITPSGANFTITATVVSGDTIEFFRVNNSASPAVTPDPSGSGEGYLFLGSCVDNGACSGPHMNANPDGNAAAGTVQVTLLASGVVSGDHITATAWSNTNGTSEFAANMVAVSVNVSGTVYSDEGVTNIGAGKTVRLLVNGISAGTAVTGAGGTYSISSSVNAGDAILVYIDGDATYKGSTVTVSNGANLSGLDIFGNHCIITRFDNGTGSLTGAHMSTALGAYADTDIEFTVPAGVLTAIADTTLYVPASHSFAPGANTSLDSAKILGEFSAGSFTHTVAATWNATAGTYTAGASTLRFFTRAGGFFFYPGASTYYNIDDDLNERSFTLGGNATVSNTYTMKSTGIGFGVLNTGVNTIQTKNFTWQSGYFLQSPGAKIACTGDFTKTGGGYFSGNGAGMTFEFNGSGNSSFNPGSGTHGSIVVNKDSQTDVVTLSTNNLVMANSQSFTITKGIFDIAGRNINIGAASTFSNDGTLRLQGGETVTNLMNDVDSGTVEYNGSGNYAGLKAGNVYYHATFNGTGSWTLADVFIAVGNITISSGTLNAAGHSIDLTGNWSNSGTFNHGNGTVELNGTGQFISGNTSFYNLTKSVASADTLTFASGSATTVSNMATLNGVLGQMLNLRSGTPGTRWNFILGAGATKAISYVDVQDSDASASAAGMKPISPANSVNSGNNIDWFSGANISGTLFEDANFTGTAADWDGGVGDKALGNVDVELYDNGGVYITSTTSDASGNYTFTSVANGTYRVRVRAATIGDADTTPMGGLNGTVPGTWPYPLPEMTWGNGVAMYGGQSATVDDTATGDNAGPGDNWVSVTLSGANVANVNFGFAYNLIVNTDDDGNANNIRSKQGSLRQFIKNANAVGSAGGTTANYSQFRMQVAANQSSGADAWWRFTVNGINLPAIADGGTTMDGSRQRINSGVDSNTLGPEIELDGGGSALTGLTINSNNNTIKGLIISNFFTGTGIRVNGLNITGNAIEGNYFGTNYSGTVEYRNRYGIVIEAGAKSNTVGGTTADKRNLISKNIIAGITINGSGTDSNTVLGNLIGTDINGIGNLGNGSGVSIENGAQSNVIGGDTAAARNVIAANSTGVVITDAGTNLNTVKGNYVGTNVNGTAALGGTFGVSILGGAQFNTIGGTAAGDRNLISGNSAWGINIQGAGTNSNTVKGNYVGTDANGTTGIPNTMYGIHIQQGAQSNTIGGTTSGEGNVIAFNGFDGIYISGATTDNNKISGNSIHSNGGLGIDIDPDGVGTGSGANNDKPRPTITGITPSGANFTIVATGTSGDTIEFFRVNNAASPAVTPDASGSGEGYLYLGSCIDNGACSGPHINAVADANAAAGTVQATLLASGLAVGDYVSATATDATNGTSEFSVNVQVLGLADLSIIKTDNPDPAPSGGGLLYTLLITNNGPTAATGVVVTDVLPASVTLQSATPSQGSCSGTTTVTCNLGSIMNTGTASVEILVVTSGTGSITNNVSVAANESDPVPGNNSASANTQVVVGGTTDIPLTQYRRIHGFVDYTVTGGSLRTSSNSVNPCAVGASSTASLSGIPAAATVVNAYLYWAGSGSTVDNQITLDGAPLTADRTWQAQYVLSPTTYDFFGGFKDVTAQVQAKRNGNYTFGGLTVATGNPYCSGQAVLAGWSVIIIYQDASLSGKTMVLYDGFDIARNGSTSYVLAGIYAAPPPEGKVTYLTWEGDETLGGTDERLIFNGTNLSDGLNPVNNVYNSTINSLGTSNSYGVDLDTFNVSSTINAWDTLASTTVSVGPDLVILNAVVLQATSNVIVGKVFEDVNYGGGAGRDLATAVAGAPAFTVPRPGATVELYDSAGTFLRSTTSGANGEYGFAGLIDGDYTVRVVNSTVTSSRTGYVGGLWPVQTFRTDAGSGTAVTVTDEVGGANPGQQDSAANVTNANLGSFFSQSKASARIITGITVTGVDFGFSFNTVVNKNDAGQGSLRQFIANANALSNSSLAQAGRTAGIDNAVFMLADGTARPGLKAGFPNMFIGGVATISPASALPDITSPVVLDAATQPGYAGTPKIEINGTGAGAGSSGFRITGGGSTVRGFTINRFGQSGIELSGSSGNTVQACYLGTDSAGAAGAPNGSGILVSNSSNNAIGGTAAGAGNLIASNRGPGVSVTGGTGNLISRNSLYANSGLGIDLAPNGVTINDSGDVDNGPNNLFNYPILTSAVVSGSNLVLSGYARPGSIVETFIAESDPTGFGEGKSYLFTAVEGGGSDSDAGTGTYGPGTINGLSQGTDTTNRFRFTVPLPGGVGAGTVLTATAIDGSSNTSEFSGVLTVQSSQYRPDAMIKLSTEGDGSYLTDNTYETAASMQNKSVGVLSGSTATYMVKVENDGNLMDDFVISGTGTGSGFTVQYLDETSTDRTVAVTGGGYTIASLDVGSSRVWTVNVTPSGNPTPVLGGTAYDVFVTATSVSDGAKTDQVKATTTSTSANLTLLKNADKANVNPGEEIAYTVTATNGAGLTAASAIALTDPIPANTGFKMGSASFNPGTSTLTSAMSYSNDNGSTWTYAPASGGCSAPAGYDYCVTHVRWSMTGNMPQGTSFSIGMVVRVK